MRAPRRLLVLAAIALATPARAAVIESPDELCDVSANPCIIDRPVQVSADHPLDFGMRVVRVEGEGHFAGTLDLRSGGFETEVADRWMDVASPVDESWLVKVLARGGCSGNSDSPCTTDIECEELDLGTCTAGDGGIRLAGGLYGIASTVELHAAGDVHVAGAIRVAGQEPAADGGHVFIRSNRGSIDVDGSINASAGYDSDYEEYYEDYRALAYAGTITLLAGGDIHSTNRIRAIGGSGSVTFRAGGSIVVTSAILAHGGRSFHVGSELYLIAGGGMRIAAVPGRRPARINLRGGSIPIPGEGIDGEPGGNATIEAGGDIIIGDGTILNADSGRSLGETDDYAVGGDWSVHAGDDLVFGATLSSRGRGRFGYGPEIELTAQNAISLDSASQLLLQTRYDTELTIESENRGPVLIAGLVDVGGVSYSDDGDFHGSGGTLYLTGGDLTVSGTIENGGGSDGGPMHFDTCRLHLTPSARIDGSLAEQDESSGENFFRIRESMIADAGSVIAGKPGSSNTIEYRDIAKPPQLNGVVEPSATLSVASEYSGCPVCGNFEIDEGETCDDGNTAAGDGCDAACRSEP